MTSGEYGNAKMNLIDSCDKFVTNDYFKTFLPDNIVKSVELLVAYFIAAQGLIFKGDKLMKLSLLNIVSWWRFLRLSYQFIKDVVEVWK
jgi:hypothetical protein